jgi:cytochrome c553
MSRPSNKVHLKTELKKAALYITAFLLLMALGGLVSVIAGLVPIKASSGHWAVTRWILNFSSERSIATHALGIQAPPLDKPGLILKGAGAYDLNCRGCHGSPSLMAPRVAAAMTPIPPYLPTGLAGWKDAEVFYVVKHGIKFTGMPAWPTQQRDDEVWAMVAFLRVFPDLDGEEYSRLVSSESPPGIETIPRTALLNCRRCHGDEGLGRGEDAFPRLAGQSPDYLVASLQAFAGGQRHSGIMEPIAADLSPEEMRELATYYSKLPKSPRASPSAEEEGIQRGREIAERGIPAQRVPSCIDCHGPGVASLNSNYPRHAGQYADYLVSQLELFKNKQRGGTPYAHLMEEVAENLNAQQMRDVAAYYASQ